MADSSLTSSLTSDSPLFGYSQFFEDTQLREVTSLQLVSMAVPIGGTSALDDRLQSLWNVNFPQAGKCIRANDASIAGFKTTIALMGLQADQCLISIDSDLLADHQAFAHLKTALAETAYILSLIHI